MRVRLVLAVLALMGFSFPALAGASVACNPAALHGTSNVCLSSPCDQLGATTMDNLSYNLIACLKNETTGELVWKSMSGSGGGGGSSFTKCQVKMTPAPTYPLCPSGWTDVHHYASGQIVAGGGAPASNGWWVTTAEDNTWFYEAASWAIATYACTVCNK